MSRSAPKRTVAVTGATGTAGRALLAFLEDDRRVGRIVAIGSGPWDPASEGWRKVEYRRVDVADAKALRRAVRGADAVVHLAFSLYGLRQLGGSLEETNVEGSRNALEAAIAAGARRFVYTSSAAVYGFDRDSREPLDEDAPLRPHPRHFYSQQKAEVEAALLDRLAEHPAMEWAIFRPCAIVGPHALGAATHRVPRRLRRLAEAAVTVGGAAGLRPPVPAPPVPLQFVHERDVGQALHRAVSGRVASGVYNLAGEGMVEGSEVPRLVGLRRLPLPEGVTRRAFGAVATLAPAPPGARWLALLTSPLALDTTRARRELGWRPEFSSREALEATRRALAI